MKNFFEQNYKKWWFWALLPLIIIGAVLYFMPQILVGRIKEDIERAKKFEEMAEKERKEIEKKKQEANNKATSYEAKAEVYEEMQKELEKNRKNDIDSKGDWHNDEDFTDALREGLDD